MTRASLAAAAVLVAVVAGKAGLLAAVPLAPPAARRAPARQELPDGQGKEVVARLCTECHDLHTWVFRRESEEGWTRIVNEMRSQGMEGSEEEFAQAIAYLATYLGKAKPPVGQGTEQR